MEWGDNDEPKDTRTSINQPDSASVNIEVDSIVVSVSDEDWVDVDGDNY